MKAPSFLTDHPASVGETYGGHFMSASGFGLRLLVAGGACLAHALLPCLFQRTASRIVGDLHTRMIAARRPTPAIPDTRDGVSA
jgi:hypothetical protein